MSVNPGKPHRPELVFKLCSFTAEQYAAILAFAEEHRRAEPEVRFDLTDAVRLLVGRGLAAGRRHR